MDAVNLDRHIRSAGTDASAWQAWLRARVPRIAPLDAPRRDTRLVVLAPHPDDEVLACGGLLRQHALRGGECLVVAITDGEASHAGLPGWAPARLARERSAESAAGLAALGLETGSKNVALLRLGVPDGRVQDHADALGRQLAQSLRPGDLVLSTWRFDGHPDHEATARCAAQACKQFACTLLEAPVWMWHWARPGQDGIPWSRLQAVALDAQSVECKRAALACHASQLAPRSARLGPVIDTGLLERTAWTHEYFFASEAAA